MSAKLFHTVHGKGPALLLLHPVGLDHSFWGLLVPLAAETHTVVAVDLCGHGRSAPATPGRGIAAYAQDIVGLLDALDLASATVLGLSFGGMIAQELTLRHPARVSRLIVGACGARIPPEAGDAVRARGVLAPDADMASIVDMTLARWFTPAFLGSSEAARVRDRLIANDRTGWAAGWDAIAGFDALERLGSIAVPTLAIAGEHDAGTPVPATKAIADAIPGAEFILIPGAPHMMQIECADRFAGCALSFLRAGTR